MRLVSFLLLLACTVGLLVPLGCERGPAYDRTSTHGELDFGDPYEIVTGESPASPDEPPAVENDSLLANVRYAGGCRDHDFRLSHRTRSDTTVIWITHYANNDTCETMLFERLSFRLPEEVLASEVLLLLEPSNDYPIFVAREH